MMNKTFKSLSPYFLLIFGLFLLLFINQPIPAGVCFLIGVVMIIERKWPEKWGNESISSK